MIINYSSNTTYLYKGATIYYPGGGGAGLNRGGRDIGMDQNIFFQYDPAHGYFFPAVRLTNYSFQPLLERPLKIANVLFIKAL